LHNGAHPRAVRGPDRPRMLRRVTVRAASGQRRFPSSHGWSRNRFPCAPREVDGRRVGIADRSRGGSCKRLASRGRRAREDRTGHPFVRLDPSVGTAPSAASRDSRASAVFILARPRTTRILLRLTPGPVRSRGVSSVGRALQWHCRGQGFDSPTLQRAPGPMRGVALGHAPQQPDEARRRRRRSAAGRGQDLAGRPDVQSGPDLESGRTCRTAESGTAAGTPSFRGPLQRTEQGHPRRRTKPPEQASQSASPVLPRSALAAPTPNECLGCGPHPSGPPARSAG
jgi:hypothetical protein